MSAKRRPKPLRLGEGSDEVPHYYGHRDRLRQRLVAAGADNLPDYELLEVILFASNLRADVKPLAKDLLEQFGGLAALLSAEPDALAEHRRKGMFDLFRKRVGSMLRRLRPGDRFAVESETTKRA
jgi:DNA repair protein RadC